MAKLVVGTRGSRLALTQTAWVVERLQSAHPDLQIETRTVRTQGDATQAANVPLSSFGEKGIFAHELEASLLSGEIDLAVHSMKDMAHTLPPGLTIAAVPEREDPRDCLVGSSLDALPEGATVGTGSVRRRALLLSKRPDLQFVEVRGNVDTRLRKMSDGQCAALCLAVAGLNRLGLAGEIAEHLDPDWFTPDPGQGALCLETRMGDRRVRDFLLEIDHFVTHENIRAERAFLRAFGGGCQTPVGALATSYGKMLSLAAMAASPDGRTILRHTETDTHGRHQALGQKVADALRAQGADKLLNADA